MRWFLLLLCISLASTGFSQDSWTVSYNGKTVLRTSGEDPEKNIITIHPADLKKKKELLVVYKQQELQKGWERFIVVFDEKDTELKKVRAGKMKLDGPALQALFQKSKTIKIFTWSLPTDPKLKASIRVRRVHLCTLILQ